MNDTRPVLVGVDGTTANEAALLYAATRARQLDANLLLVHVVPRFVPVDGFYVGPLIYDTEDQTAAGEAVLGEAVTLAKTLIDPERVHGRLVDGDPGTELLAAAADARLVLLGTAGSLVERLTAGSAAGIVATYAHVPVIAVPPGWTMPQTTKMVVAAVKRIAAVPSALIDAAAELAVSQNASLHVVHVYDKPEVYGDLATKMTGTQNWAELIDEPYTGQEAKLRAHLAASYPDITVTVEVRPGHPATVLRELSAQASVLLIARRAHAFPVGHFGHVGRSLLHTARCPLEVLPVSEVSAPQDEPTSLASAADR